MLLHHQLHQLPTVSNSSAQCLLLLNLFSFGSTYLPTTAIHYQVVDNVYDNAVYAALRVTLLFYILYYEVMLLQLVLLIAAHSVSVTSSETEYYNISLTAWY